MPIDPHNLDEVVQAVLSWAKSRESRYVCVANVHMAVETRGSAEFASVLEGADLVTTDGMPLVWMARFLGWRDKRRVPGREQVLHICAAAESAQVPIGLLGGTPETLERLEEFLRNKFPLLSIGYVESPPFRPATQVERAERIRQISSSGVGILFVGLGCPKQEIWMAQHRGEIPASMIGVGAAFDFLSGGVATAPNWMQAVGLEWFHRLAQEPRRLWKRYAVTNTKFALLALGQVLNVVKNRAAKALRQQRVNLSR